MVLDHMGRLQIFVLDRIVLSHNGKRRLMKKVLPLAAHLLMRLGEQDSRLLAAVAAFFPAHHTALGGLERAFRLAIPSGRKDARAIREG
jgi:hypothetical protein